MQHFELPLRNSGLDAAIASWKEDWSILTRHVVLIILPTGGYI
jgi:hypothetical protein